MMMNPTALLLAAALGITSCSGIPITPRQGSPFVFTGANEACAELGNDVLPGQLGKEYTWPVESAMRKLMDTGTNTGKYAIVDPHNFGRCYDEIITDTSGFKAWWTTVAPRYKDNSLVIFDTNNEYHDMDNQLVADLRQAAIDGVRAAGATQQYIFVEANSWTGAWNFIDQGGVEQMKNLYDPQDKIVYELHQYLDSDGSATEWMRANGKKAILGETAGGVNDQCKQAVTGMLDYLSQNTEVWQGWMWWAAGPWWGGELTFPSFCDLCDEGRFG
ncbi:glycoside hydrolase family 5 protein [Zalerion maritima]|uniref:cellulase n=1 Tax=Zalerion maritima TaxID=339359 RepID=A0AAD5RHB1_9PEZI|nr:glycoside hydrolase family 5 protein [Zalerion maritima]